MSTNDEAFQNLAENVTDEFTSCIVEMRLGFQQVATALREHASKASDIAVSAEREEAKRTCLALWRASADRMEQLAAEVDK